MGGKVVKALGVVLALAGFAWLGWSVWSWAVDRSDQIDSVGVIVGLVGVIIGLSAWLWPRQLAGSAVAPAVDQSISVDKSISVDRSIRIGHQEGGVNITGDQTSLHIDRGGERRRDGGDR